MEGLQPWVQRGEAGSQIRSKDFSLGWEEVCPEGPGNTEQVPLAQTRRVRVILVSLRDQWG